MMDLTSSLDAFEPEATLTPKAALTSLTLNPTPAALPAATPVAPTSSAAPQAVPAPATSPWVRLAWVVSLFGGAGGAVFGYLAISFAPSPSQQAAGAAFACLIALAPYVVARSVQELAR
jgi:hypothetical protein